MFEFDLELEPESAHDGRTNLWKDGKSTPLEGFFTSYVFRGFEDREGSLWIGMWGAGIARWPSPKQWTNWTIADGLPNPIVWAVRRQGSNLWVGTDRGLVRFDARWEPRTWLHKNGLAGEREAG